MELAIYINTVCSCINAIITLIIIYYYLYLFYIISDISFNTFRCFESLSIRICNTWYGLPLFMFIIFLFFMQHFDDFLPIKEPEPFTQKRAACRDAKHAGQNSVSLGEISSTYI